MKNKKLNAIHVWKQTEDLLIPQLHLDLVERAVYYHLLRHSHLEGKPWFRFSKAQPPARTIDPAVHEPYSRI
jgi:hypothetical protein